MRRQTRPSVESLEGKALLTGLAVSTAIPDLSYSLTARQVEVKGHSEIDLTLTVTNESTQTEGFSYGPSDDGFVAKQDGRVVWESNSGATAQFLVVGNLAAGQSKTFTATWNEVATEGSKSGAAVTGAVTFDNELAPTTSTQLDIAVPAPPSKAHYS
jgi:hypothetical protein